MPTLGSYEAMRMEPGKWAPDDDSSAEISVTYAGMPVEVTYERDYTGDVYVLAVTHAGLTLDADDLSQRCLDALAANVRAKLED